MVIQALVQRGVYICDIARQLGCTRTRSARARVAAPDADAAEAEALLDAHQAHVDQLLAERVWNACAYQKRRTSLFD
jgi:hypothetical protein